MVIRINSNPYARPIIKRCNYCGKLSNSSMCVLCLIKFNKQSKKG